MPTLIEGEGALGENCPKDRTHLRIVKEENHMSYGKGNFGF
jgi:hypothetical protein